MFLKSIPKKNLNELMKFYYDKSLNRINLKKYIDDIIFKIPENCKVSKEFVNELYKTISLEE